MKKALIIFVFLFLITFGYSQPIKFHRTYGFSNHDFLQSRQTPDRGHILFGEKDYNSSAEDILIVKTDSVGNIEWAKVYGTPSDDYVWGLEVLNNSYLVSAQSTPNPLTRFLFKIDSVGNVIWVKTNVFARNMIKTSDGGLVFTTPVGLGTTLLTKLDSSFNLVWRTKYNIQNLTSTTSIKQAFDGGFWICGNMTGFNGSPDFSVVRTDSLGNIQWAKMYGGNAQDWYPCIEATFDGGAIMTGTTQSFGAGSDDIILIKLDVAGNVQWSKTYGGSMNDNGAVVKRTFGSIGYIITGNTPGFSVSDDSAAWGWMRSFLIKTDINGNFQWARRYGLGGPSDIAAYVWQTIDGGYTFSGCTSGWGAGGLDGWLIKTDNMGVSGCYDWPTLPLVTSPTVLDSVLIFTQSPDTLTIGTGTLWDSIVTPFTTIECLSTLNGINFQYHDNSDFNLFPNPASHTLTLDVKDLKNLLKFEIYNSLGQFMLSAPVTSAQNEINVSEFPVGIYLLRVVTSKNEVHSTKFIKE